MALVGAKRDLKDDDPSLREEIEREMRDHFMGKYEVLFVRFYFNKPRI